MLRTLFAGSVMVALASSCASAPSKQPAQAPTPVSAPTPATGPVKTAAVLPIEPHGVLGRGQCVDGFDCVDTVGFPASGYRWACVEGKCQKAKLFGFSGDVQQPDQILSKSEPAKRSSKARKSGRSEN